MAKGRRGEEEETVLAFLDDLLAEAQAQHQRDLEDYARDVQEWGLLLATQPSWKWVPGMLAIRQNNHHNAFRVVGVGESVLGFPEEDAGALLGCLEDVGVDCYPDLADMATQHTLLGVLRMHGQVRMEAGAWCADPFSRVCLRVQVWSGREIVGHVDVADYGYRVVAQALLEIWGIVGPWGPNNG